MYGEESPAQNQPQAKDRGYICPCGKSYLSYPALFTHIKQKHDGKAPGQVIRPKSLNKRGRPKKDFNRGQKEVSEQQSQQSEQSPWDNAYKDRLKAKSIDKQRKSNGQFLKSKQAKSEQYSASQESQQLSSYDRLLILKEKFTNHFKNMTQTSGDKIKQLLLKCQIYQQLIKHKKKGKQSQKQQSAQAQAHSDYNQFGLDLQLGSQEKYQRKYHEKDPKIGESGDGDGDQHQNENEHEHKQLPKLNEKNDCYEVEMGYAFSQFIKWVDETLPQHSHLQLYLFVALICQFIGDEIDADGLHNIKYFQLTTNFNNFIYYYLFALRKNEYFSQFFLLKGDKPLNTLMLINEWMQIHKFTHYKIKVNPQWKGEKKQPK